MWSCCRCRLQSLKSSRPTLSLTPEKARLGAMSFLNSSSNGDEIVFLLIADGWQMKKLSKELLCKNHWILLRFFGPRLLKKAFFGLIQWSRERHLQCHNSPPDTLELDVVIAVLSSFTAVKTTAATAICCPNVWICFSTAMPVPPLWLLRLKLIKKRDRYKEICHNMPTYHDDTSHNMIFVTTQK